MYKYILGLFSVMLGIISCTENRIEIGGIASKQQLDSIMAMLPPDSVSVDSLPGRTLLVRIQGGLSLFGTPVREAAFSLKKEDLAEMSVVNVPSGVLSLLNTIEEEYGLGMSENGTFVWEADTRQFILQPVDAKKWFSGASESLLLNDTVGFNFIVAYAGNADNKITNLYKEVPKSTGSYVYSVNPLFYPGINFELYINGILLKGAYTNINNMLPLAGRQVLTVTFRPPFNKIREIDAYISLTGGPGQIVTVNKQDKNGTNKTQLASMAVDADVDKNRTSQSFIFRVDDLPYTLDYAKGVDMRTNEDAKQLVYAHYRKLKDAVDQKDGKALADLMYPLEKNSALSLNKNRADMQRSWKELDAVLDNNEGVDLMDINSLDVEFAFDGRLARLVPKDDKDGASVPLRIYMASGLPVDATYYVYMDDAGKINFGVR